MLASAAVRTQGKTMPSAPYTYTSPDDPAREDEGLFGPGSVTWRVMSNRIMWVAIVRALYLQALHPRVIRGTLQNAATITQPVDAWARLRRTLTFIEARTFGTTAEAERAGLRVRKIHQVLTGTDPDGTRYRVDEPELLLWVHCGEVASCADIARRSGLPFSAAAGAVDGPSAIATCRGTGRLPGERRGPRPEAGRLMAGLLTDQLRLMAHAYPDKVAYCNVDSGDRVTFAAWEAESNRLARGLRARGVGKGDRVGIYLEPGQILDWIVTYSAVHKAGAVSVPTNNRLSPGEVKTIYEHAEVTAVVTTGRYADTVGPLIGTLTSLRLVVRVGDRPLPGSVGVA